MPDLPPCRLSLVFAREAPVAVILRRGPSRWVEVIRWNTIEDSFDPGAWFRGHIYGEKCGLSPDGELFVYFAMQHSKVQEGYDNVYTAVSRPPWLTALAVWPQGTTYGGGGRFVGNRELAFDNYGVGSRVPPHHPDHPPTGLVVRAWRTGVDRHGPSEGHERRFRSVRDARWSGVDHRERVIFVRDGALYRVTEECGEVPIADFNDHEPEPRRSPEWARRW